LLYWAYTPAVVEPYFYLKIVGEGAACAAQPMKQTERNARIWASQNAPK
jgi:hypothetical protein